MFLLQAALFGNQDLGIIKKGQELTVLLCSLLVATEIEQAWLVCAPSMIKALGFEDDQVKQTIHKDSQNHQGNDRYHAKKNKQSTCISGFLE